MSLSTRRACAAAVLALLFWHTPGHSQVKHAVGSPHTIVPEIAHDFGPVEPGARVTHTFAVRNAGDAPLTILRAEVSEPGMRSRFTPVVAPGETGRVSIEWVADRQHGNLDAQVVVHFDDPKRPWVTLTLTGVVSRSIDVQPSSELHVSLYHDETVERRVAIVNTEQRPLAVHAARSLKGLVAVELQTMEAGQRYEVAVRVPEGLEPGRHHDIVEVDTDHPRLTQLNVAVNVFVKDDLFANPERIEFGTLSLQQVKTPSSLGLYSRTTTLRKRSGTFAITGLKTDVPGLRVDRAPAGSSKSFGLTLTLDPKHVKPGSLDGSVTIRTDDKKFPVIVLPVSGEIR